MIKKVIAILMSAGIIITSLSGCSIDKTILGNDVTIDGETCKNVSFKTKGNTSLSVVASYEDSDCLDVDEVIKYFVAHNFVDNYDSYTGNMLHQWLIIQ